MIGRPIFKRSLHVVIDSEGLFLLSERGHVLLTGKLYRQLAPMLDGSRTSDEVVDALADVATPAEVYYAITLLERKGYVVENTDAEIPDARLAFWDALGLDPRAAESRLRSAAVAVHQFGETTIGPLESALAAFGVRVQAEGDFAVVATHDYLQEDLDGFNAAALVAGRSWLLVKPVGTIVWIGPLFRAGGGCWECLAQRLRQNRPVESYLLDRSGATAPFPLARAALPTTAAAALDVAALEVVKHIAGHAPAGERLKTVDLVTGECREHQFVRRPQCQRCNPGYRSDLVPITLEPQPKRVATDGGYRTVSPQATVARYGHHVSPLIGAVTVLTPSPLDEDGFLPVYVSGQNPTVRCETLAGLRMGLRNGSAGKGTTVIQARASALCEALERYSGNFYGEEVRRRASFRELGEGAVHPNACMLFSADQYRQRAEWNSQSSGSHYIPEPFDEEAVIDWTPLWSMTEERFKCLPTSYCYYGYTAPGPAYCWADSNGSAAGNTPEEAIFQGFLELVERDSVALWWYNRVRRPAVDLESFDEPYARRLREIYRALGCEVWALDLTSDLDIPTFAALSRRTDGAVEDIRVGFGAHLDPAIGLRRALTELNQSAAMWLRTGGHGSDADGFDEVAERRRWRVTATLANQPYLVPKDGSPRTRDDYASAWSEDLREDVVLVQATVEQKGFEVLVLDQTRPDIELPVFKVIVPGLRHFWPRFGPGRLYDVPVKLGWLAAPLTEEKLNPIAVPD